eukprot:TRINITY_DN128812_c0_g1_i1.p1 TRINITY_DN128812_c0_g1~~TRINITY_DN128812_c0_g1_i1.p1  ORF type:complete len:226 (+),score=79.84 TRINITY_DN128812_c0_g1_i1:138-815(+)
MPKARSGSPGVASEDDSDDKGGGKAKKATDKKKDKKDKKDKKLKKLEKKAAKEAKKLEKARKKIEKKASKKAKKKKKSSSSSSSSSDSGDLDLNLNFVMEKGFGVGGAIGVDHLDAQHADRKIQKVLGIGYGQSFVSHADDEQLVKEASKKRNVDESGKFVEDRSRDWECKKMRGNGEMCATRNWAKNDKCITCGALREASQGFNGNRDQGEKKLRTFPGKFPRR